MAVPSNLTQALAMLTASAGARIRDLALREVVTWLAAGAVDPAWATQAYWAINSSIGLDTNDGTQATQGAGNVGPLRTLTEYARRIIAVGGHRATQTVVVDILTNTLSTDFPYGTINVFRDPACVGPSLLFRGSNGITSIRTGTFSAVTAANPATNTYQQGTDSLGRTWTAYIPDTLLSGSSGIRVRNTTAGARLNSKFWLWSDLTGGACRFSQPFGPVDRDQSQYLQSLNSLNAGDTYALEQLPIIHAWGLNIAADSGSSYPYEAVQFVDLCMSSLDFLTIPTMQHNLYAALVFYDCDIGLLSVFGPQTGYVNCQRYCNGFLSYDEDIFAGLTISQRLAFGSGFGGSVNQRHACNGLLISGTSGVNISGLQFTGLLELRGGACPHFIASTGAREVFGVSSGVAAIRVGETCMPRYSGTTSGITATGSQADVAFGANATQRNYAQLPYVQSDATSHCGMVSG